MRDLIFTFVVLGMVPACFKKPFLGLVMFSWLAYMRPQDLTWGFAREQRWSYLIAVVTFAGFLRSRPERWFLPNWRTYVMFALMASVGISVAVSKDPTAFQFTKYLEFSKILVIALFTTAVVQRREQLRMLLWIIALSLGFYGVKSGIWGILTGFRLAIIRGPGGMMEDNNALALALSMAVPLLVHIGMTEQRKLVRRAFLLAVPLTALTVILTHSRGGFLSLGAAVFVLIWHSRNRVAVFSAAGLVALVALMLVPQSYTERISTIAEYKTEGSAAGRIYSWGVGTRMALGNPVLGVGLDKYRQHWLEFDPNPTPARLAGHAIIEAHNSYIQIWAESGTISLALYLSLLASCYVMIWKVRTRAKRHFHTSWMLNYCAMFEASITAFVVGGSFLDRAHFDLIYHFVAIILVFGKLALDEIEDPLRYPARDGQRGVLAAFRPRSFGRPSGQSSYARGFRDGTAGLASASAGGTRTR